jgi:hypothetical protein
MGLRDAEAAGQFALSSDPLKVVNKCGQRFGERPYFFLNTKERRAVLRIFITHL